MVNDPPTIQIARAYQIDDSINGFRVLVDRLWPRGVSRASLRLDFWAKNLAPSTDLRTWFDHEIEKWPEFAQRYWTELLSKEEECRSLLQNASCHPILLIFAAKDPERNNAVVLRNFLQQCGASEPNSLDHKTS